MILNRQITSTSASSGVSEKVTKTENLLNDFTAPSKTLDTLSINNESSLSAKSEQKAVCLEGFNCF